MNAPRDPAHDVLVRARQRSRARVLAILLGAFALLVFAISIAKIQRELGTPHAAHPRAGTPR